MNIFFMLLKLMCKKVDFGLCYNENVRWVIND